MSYASTPLGPYRDSATSIRTGSPPRLPALGAWGLLAVALGLALGPAIAAAEPGVGHHRVRPAAAAPAESRRPADLRGLADEAPLVQPAAEIGGRIRSVAPVGSVAWLAQGRRVWAVDLADPGQPRDLGPGLRFDGAVDALAVEGTLGLAAVGGDLWALNLADALAPKLGGRLTLPRPRGSSEALSVQRILIHQQAAYVQTECWLDLPDETTGDPIGSIAVVDLRRPAEPRLAVEALLSVSTGSAIEDLQRVGAALAVLVRGDMASAPPFDDGYSVRLFDLRRPLAPKEAGRIEDPSLDRGTDHLLAQRQTPLGPRLVLLGSAMVRGGDGRDLKALTLADWDISDALAPKKTKMSYLLRGDSCSQRVLGAWLAPDDTLYLSCQSWLGSSSSFGEIARARPGDSLRRIAWSDGALHSPLAPVGRLLVAGAAEGLLVVDPADASEDAWASTYPLVTDGGDLAAARLGGLPTLLSLHGELISLDVSMPLRPLPLEWLRFGYASLVSLSDGLAAVASYGGGDIFQQVIYVADLRDPRQPRMVGSISAEAAVPRDGHFVVAQSAGRLALRAADDRADLYRLAFDAPPAKAGSITVPGGSLVGLAMSGDLLATLSLERPSGTADAISPLTLALFQLEDRGDAVRATLIGQRRLAADAQANPRASNLLMTPDWLVVNLALGCGGRKEQGVMMLRLGPAPDESSLYRQAWLRHTGRALLLHDGYLFVQAWGEVGVLDIRQLAARPWAWREAARLAVADPQAMAAIDGTLYVSGDHGLSIFQPDLPWASDPAVPTPTEPATPPPLTPTEPVTPCLSPTPTATASATATPSRTASATPTARVSATPTWAPGRRLWLPLVGD